jgi:hypothetical protein
MKNINTEFIIILLLWLSILLSLYFNYKFDAYFIFGILGLSFATITYKKFNDLSFGILLFTVLFSTINIVKFSVAFGINIGFLNLPSLIVFIILFFKKRNKIFELNQKWFGTDQNELENRKQNKVEYFKREFKSLSETELDLKLRNLDLVSEAKLAILQLKNEIKKSK